MTRITLNADIPARHPGPCEPIFARVLDDTGDTLISVLEHGTLAKARKKLVTMTRKALRDARDRDTNWERLLIGTVEGSVFLVEWLHGGWGYSITGPDRNVASSCMSSANSFDAICDEARKHAESGFNGIAWESRI